MACCLCGCYASVDGVCVVGVVKPVVVGVAGVAIAVAVVVDICGFVCVGGVVVVAVVVEGVCSDGCSGGVVGEGGVVGVVWGCVVVIGVGVRCCLREIKADVCLLWAC